MAEVVSLEERRRQWTACQIHCIGCDHEWIGVAPAEHKWLECPQCKAQKGLRKSIISPSSDWAMFFVCPHCNACYWTPYLDKKTGKPCLMCIECGGIRDAMELFPAS